MTDAFISDPREAAEHAPDTSPETSPGEAQTSVRPGQDSGFSVALTLELETMHVPLNRLQALREGAVLPLDASEGPIPVRVVAGGRTIARGTLVNVGPGYGVLIGPEEG
ncbi:flagellar motor switch protein FliN/FliY [Novosphingobium chloroacetimidivorans]|uniref:Flagellar motor switch protein FliN/FliY n=1 Tax=Novosphingobium chloroacetimidivorans TaxID=1428314 RepID=A0A7W7KAB3_9SPHN|nr:FliM/FliN family flagellar motor C-terminal domain-containing protein [Novosphingobium chloroacetimidivorans]MBB4858841.1 flagellar motor switch protein FliN/FliY [Novosphingobium chloroacetimidivorans]